MASFESSLIAELQDKLNSKEFAPRRGYRRDVHVYELVSYVNNITGCYLSRNADPIPVFIERARGYMEDNQATNDLLAYYDLVSKYLSAVERQIG